MDILTNSCQLWHFCVILWVFVWNKHQWLTEWFIWFDSKPKERRLSTHSRRNTRSTAVLRSRCLDKHNAVCVYSLYTAQTCILHLLTHMHAVDAERRPGPWHGKTAETHRTRNRQITSSSCARKKITKLRTLFHYTPLMLLWQADQLFWEDTFLQLTASKLGNPPLHVILATRNYVPYHGSKTCDNAKYWYSNTL